MLTLSEELDMLEMVKKFLYDERAWDMYVTGAAGTGKTTDLGKTIAWCMLNDIPYVVCAYTHKACGVLVKKLPPGANVTTLHSWLKKRPGINQDAKNIKHVQINTKMGASERARIVFIDEYSNVGEKDLMDVRLEQDNNYSGIPDIKVVWLGDPHQLPPVGDLESVRPHGPYQLYLTKVYRQKGDSELRDTLTKLISYIDGEPPKPLIQNKNFVRGINIVEHFKASKRDKVLLAYTNKRVQEMNAEVQGYAVPKPHDITFNSSTRQRLVYLGDEDTVNYIDLRFNEQLHLESKYKTLEYLMDAKLANIGSFIDEEDNNLFFAYVFGHYNYKQKIETLKVAAAKSNMAIEAEFPGTKAAQWAKANYDHPLARTRAKAWREFMTFSECVMCIDFPHAMTVHKSQGSTFEDVYVDMSDLAVCSNKNMNLYLRLTYVALSRAEDMVYTD